MEASRSGGNRSMTVIEHLEAARNELLGWAGDIGRMLEYLQREQIGPVVLQARTSQPARPARARGKVSMRAALLETLEEERRPMPVTELLERAKAKGVVTDAADPLNTVDLTLYKAKTKGAPILKPEGQARTWQWDAGKAQGNA